MLEARTQLVRIYNPKYLRPNDYNHFGPRGRFDHHRSKGTAGIDSERGVYYAAANLAGSVVEVFGDTGTLERGMLRAAMVEVSREVRLLDLVGDGAWRAGSVATLTKDETRHRTQEWARHFYDDVATYGMVEGLRYENAHDGALAFALFERAGALVVVEDVALASDELEDELATISEELGLMMDDGEAEPPGGDMAGRRGW